MPIKSMSRIAYELAIREPLLTIFLGLPGKNGRRLIIKLESGFSETSTRQKPPRQVRLVPSLEPVLR